jgi:hypothetical protein
VGYKNLSTTDLDHIEDFALTLRYLLIHLCKLLSVVDSHISCCIFSFHVKTGSLS